MTSFQKWLIWATSALTGLTGLVYWWMDQFLEPVGEFAVINHPLQPWLLKAHIVVAPLLVFAVGVIWMGHVWKHFRNAMQRARRTGLSALILIGPMVLSGYLIQAVTSPMWLTWLVWIHIVGGAVYLVALIAHKVAVQGSLPGAGAVRASRRRRLRDAEPSWGPAREGRGAGSRPGKAATPR